MSPLGKACQIAAGGFFQCSSFRSRPGPRGVRLSGRVVEPQYLIYGERCRYPFSSLFARHGRAAYGFNNANFPGTGGSVIKADGTGQTIAIVVAYQQPDLVADVHTFGQAYGLPDDADHDLNQNGSTDPAKLPSDATGNWGLEASLDVEWAHASRPAPVSWWWKRLPEHDELVQAVDTARQAGTGSLVPCPSPVVSMSWGFADFSGDSQGAPSRLPPARRGSPSSRPAAIKGHKGFIRRSIRTCVRRRNLVTTDSQGNYLSESAWGGSNGGFGANAEPAYQQGIQPYGATNNGLAWRPMCRSTRARS